LIAAFGVGNDVVALVGAGGKTTLAFALAREGVGAGLRVVVTTTTKLGVGQDGGMRVVSTEADEIASALGEERACVVISGREGEKALGVGPEWVDELWSAGVADLVIVEADGARRRKVKAPAAHEPVIPRSATLVVAVMGVAALGAPSEQVAHRPRLVASVAGVAPSDVLTPEAAVRVLTSRHGGRKGVPTGARFAVALTGDAAGRHAAVREVVERLTACRVVVVAPSGTG
jgi:molybdenum cofactor cytidylyltransferase